MTNIGTPRRYAFQSGVTLLEICLALVLIGVLYALFYSSSNWSKVIPKDVSATYMAQVADMELSLARYALEKQLRTPPGVTLNYLDDLSSSYGFTPASPFDKSYGKNGYVMYSSGTQIYICARAVLGGAHDTNANALSQISAQLPSGKFYYNTAVCPQTANSALGAGTYDLTYFISR